MLAAPEGRRNHTLNAAAYNLGQLVGAALLTDRLAVDALTAAGTTIGLTSREIQATVRSGLSAGARHPRGVSA